MKPFLIIVVITVAIVAAWKTSSQSSHAENTPGVFSHYADDIKQAETIKNIANERQTQAERQIEGAQQQ